MTRWVLLAAGLVGPCLPACSDEPWDLLVDVRTDLVPGVEFSTVRTERFVGLPEEGDVPEAVWSRGFSGDAPFLAGERVAEFLSTRERSQALRLSLIDDLTGPVATRLVLVSAGQNTVITAVLTRTCVGVVCPPGPNGEARTCIDGRCAAPDCTPETPDACPTPVCTVDGDCPVPVASCASAVCAEGSCLVSSDSSGCTTGEWCDPDVGCTPLPSTPCGAACTCPPGEVCRFMCDGTCAVACEDGAVCSVACSGGDPNCSLACALGASCTLACGATDTCRGNTTFEGDLTCNATEGCSAL